MKQTRLIAVLVALVLVLAITAGAAFAQGNPAPQGPGLGQGFGRGMMGQGMMQGRQGGMMGQYGQGTRFGPSMMGDFNLVDVIAAELGLTADEVRAELATGITVTDLAAKYNVAVQDIIDAALAQHQAALDAAVAAGTITADQAELMQANMASMLAARFAQPWGGPRGGGRGMMNGGCTGTGPQGRWNNAPGA